MKSLKHSLAIIGTIIGAWIFATEYFALASDVKQYELTTEQAFVEMQIDIIEDRIERAEETGRINKIKRLNKRLKRIEKRQELLELIQLEKK